MERSMKILLLLKFLSIAIIAISVGSCYGNLDVSCKETEKQALLTFKKDIKDPANRLSSWTGEGDCCKWTRVVCDDITGHIRELRLGNSESWLAFNSSLGGKINQSLLKLKHLNFLDLSYNNFQHIQIPIFFGSLKSLSHLDLSNARFEGIIPQQLGNLSNLRDLRLGGYGTLKVDNLHWISGLSQLEHLVMSNIDLSKASDWLQATNSLPSLVELSMSSCGLQPVHPPPTLNFTSLAILDLSGNEFNSMIPGWIFSLRNLVSLDLFACFFQGRIPSSSQNITALREIDLTSNNISFPLPEWLFHQKKLDSFGMSYNFLEGPVPVGFSNLTTLKVLNLASNLLSSSIPKWLFNFSHLESLDLSDNHLQGEMLSSIDNWASMVDLNLDQNQLEGEIPKSYGKLCKLMNIGLSRNKFSGRLSENFENFSRCNSVQIEVLSLGNNNLSGHLPAQVGSLQNLAVLDLSGNSISGPLPVSLGNLSSLVELRLFDNQFTGVLPEAIGQLKMLRVLDISYNSLEGTVSEVHYAHLGRMYHFNANGNSLTLNTSRDWLPPFQLERLELDSCHVGPDLPLWLQRQAQLKLLSLSNTKISGTIPNWFWSLSSQLSYMNLSHNQLYGEIQNIVAGPGSVIDLSFNQFNGSLPFVSYNVSTLDLSNSHFSGSVSHFFCDKVDGQRQIWFLYLDRNLLTGRIPDCWVNWQNLQIVNLDRNNFTGNIPRSIGYLVNLRSLHLRSNHLSGEIPQSMQNCTNLVLADLRDNKFAGSLPSWLGKSLSNLMILNLRLNQFQGDIPHELCNLANLQILDLAHNNLSGTIPRCFFNLTAMATLSKSDSLISLTDFFSYGRYIDKLDYTFLVTKGKDMEYSRILGLVTSMDLSDNKLSGEIPDELTYLIGLRTLNLSGNLLSGRIPSNIGNMDQLESVDFSMNQLYGEIPASMRSMTFLSHLNLSYNNLTGRIPESTQLQTLDQSSFIGNELCGPPLNKNCSENNVVPPPIEQNRGYHLLKDKWFYLSLGLGFMFGFWSVFGGLLINMPWSSAFSGFLDSILHKVYGVIG